MQITVSAMNRAFSAESLRGLRDGLDAFNPVGGNTLVDALKTVPGVELPDAVLDFVGGWPSALQRCVQAVIWENLTREATVPITFAWTPGYDYSVTVYDVLDTADTAGGITVLLTSRYPRDPHPLSSSTGA